MFLFDEDDGGVETRNEELLISGVKGCSMLLCCSAKQSDALLVRSPVGTYNAAAESASSPCACTSVAVPQCWLSATH